MGHKTREVGIDANLLSLHFYVLLALLSQLPVFLKFCIKKNFSIFCNVSYSVVSGAYPWVTCILPS